MEKAISGYLEATIKTQARRGGLNLLRDKDASFPLLIQSFPRILLLSLETRLKPMVEFLKDVCVPKRNLRNVVLLYPPILFYDVEKDIKPAFIKVSFSQLVGKRVIIFFDEGKLRKQEAEFLKTLTDQYNQMKDTDDEFEVIHITELSTKTGHVADLPWLVQRRGRDDNIFRLFGFNVSLIAFDRNGLLARKAVYPAFENTNFPFYAGGLEKEALSQAVNLFG